MTGGVAASYNAPDQVTKKEYFMRKTVHLCVVFFAIAAFALLAGCDSAGVVELDPTASILADGPDLSRGGNSSVRVNVLLNTAITDEIRAEVETIGKVSDELLSINAMVVQGKASIIEDLQALPYVEAVNFDAERHAPPIVGDAVPDVLVYGMSTWDLDAINVTDVIYEGGAPVATGRVLGITGSGVYVAVLDTGLVNDWPEYFPAERIATEYAISFGGGGGDNGHVSDQPNKWEHDTASHGTHVTSTILGYSFYGTPINGVAPWATVIPVKVLNQNGSGWSSVVARGIEYVGDLKAGPLAEYPVVINMSLGGPVLDAVEQAAVDYAIAQGVIIVASAGNNGTAGMGYPGACEPVISVAASGWTGEWIASGWPFYPDVPEAIDPLDYYIVDFSGHELAGQDLDVAAPGSWVVGPYQVSLGQLSYYYLGGTSMASPHVAGIVALMAELDPTLDAATAEALLEGAAIPFEGGAMSRMIVSPYGVEIVEFGDDATGEGLITADAALIAVINQ
jgi:subtilisin family serine protease